MEAAGYRRTCRGHLLLRTADQDGCAPVLTFTVIPGRAKREPGISRFRVWSFGPSRNDGVERAFAGDDAYSFNFQTASFADTASRSRRACARVLPGTSCPRKNQRAQGKPGARCTRSLVCSVLVAHECSYHRSTGTPGLPCAMVLTACFVLSPVTGLSCHRRLAETPAKLDASVGASGPHDFAVRVSIIRPARYSRA